MANFVWSGRAAKPRRKKERSTSRAEAGALPKKDFAFTPASLRLRESHLHMG